MRLFGIILGEDTQFLGPIKPKTAFLFKSHQGEPFTPCFLLRAGFYASPLLEPR